MLYYNRTDINEGVDRTESNRNKKWMFCHCWFFKCNCCHDLTTLCLNISKITIIAVKNVDYCCIIHNISNSYAIDLLENSILEDWFILLLRFYTWVFLKNIVLNLSQLKAGFFYFFVLLYIKWFIMNIVWLSINL